MDLNKLIRNKPLLLVLLILNLMGTFFAYYTYVDDVAEHLTNGIFFVIPFFMVSFWLFLFAFFFVLYLYLDLEVPELFANLTFIYCFVYGVGSFLFYPLFMIFVRGITSYHIWNVFAHGFVGLQALLFLYTIKKTKSNYLFILGAIFLIKDFFDLYFGGFLYFVKFDFPPFLKVVLSLIIIGLQLVAFYLLYRKIKRLK